MKQQITADITVYGKVQGVGFRPLVCRLAKTFHLTGYVKNAGTHVEIVAAGMPEQIDCLCEQLRNAAPPVRVENVVCKETALQKFAEFTSVPSTDAEEIKTVSADIGICPHCLQELQEEDNPRQGYSYISCAQCGPRYTIIRKLPYDRVNTTMDRYALCEDCCAEYNNMENRRGHGETISCFHCGPQLHCFVKESYVGSKPFSRKAKELLLRGESEAENKKTVRKLDENVFWISGSGKFKENINATYAEDEKIIGFASALLEQDQIIMVKAVGGFNLVCRADKANVVARLRDLKKRMSKPFAVMVRDVKAAEQIAFVSGEEKSLLESAARPIVLLQKKNHRCMVAEEKDAGDSGKFSQKDVMPSLVADNVTDVSDQVGVMFPSMGFYALLDVPFPLIVTSCNYAGEPIIYKDGEALRFFEAHDAVAALFTYDRDILRPADDGVARVILGRPQLLRRTKGYMPEPAVAVKPGRKNESDVNVFSVEHNGSIQLQQQNSCSVFPRSSILAVGAEMKPGFCLAADGKFFPAEIPGDITLEQTESFFEETVTDWIQLLNIKPDAIVADLHPGYASTVWGRNFAERRGLPFYQVQHHHAHALSVMAEHHLTGKTLAVCFDGTGAGTDGTVWGGEFLLCEGTDFTRVGHLKPIAMLGGDSSMQQAWKTGLCHLAAAGIAADDRRYPVVRAALQKNINCITTTSMGRLFDAAASILGLADFNSHQGRCAMALEAVARNAVTEIIAPLPLSFAMQYTEDKENKSGKIVFDPGPLWQPMLEAKGNLQMTGAAALGFHYATVDMVLRMAQKQGVEQIVLAGGCFANRILLEASAEALGKGGFRVYFNESVSPGDGGIGLGQAYYGLLRMCGQNA
ncbi:MAG: carbamoyltransferase HypF [Acidaminococcaceae bacterium]|nr:carbamoyltransferase HypF [Acidaminococcaceae bacterium]